GVAGALEQALVHSLRPDVSVFHVLDLAGTGGLLRLGLPVVDLAEKVLNPGLLVALAERLVVQFLAQQARQEEHGEQGPGRLDGVTADRVPKALGASSASAADVLTFPVSS